MSIDFFGIPPNVSLVLNHHIPEYVFVGKENMLKVNGAGLISGHGDAGVIGASEVKHVIFNGDFEASAEPVDNQGETLTFTGVSFVGTLDLTTNGVKQVNFVNCCFCEDSKITLDGSAGSVSVFGCFMEPGSTLDMGELTLNSPAMFFDTDGDETAGVVMPKTEQVEKSSWKLPLLALAAVGAASAFSKAKQKKIKRASAVQEQMEPQVSYGKK